jgi:hypothetical protein
VPALPISAATAAEHRLHSVTLGVNARQAVAVVMLLPLVWILRSNAAKAQARAIAAGSGAASTGDAAQLQLQEPLLIAAECASETAAMAAGWRPALEQFASASC